MAVTHWLNAQNSNYLRDITVAVLQVFGNKCFWQTALLAISTFNDKSLHMIAIQFLKFVF
jgi:hypothetical protein|tara:strand:+ start:58178 stop:58357 length:180 start_codon:yes stop_codon:yes gene_type:complete